MYITKNITLLACTIALSASSVESQEMEVNVDCNYIILNDNEHSLLEQTSSVFLGKTESDLRASFGLVGDLKFDFDERVPGHSGLVYDFFIANRNETIILVAFAFNQNTVQEFYIRAYLKTGANPDTADVIPVSCFLDPTGYVDFVRRKFPPDSANVDDFLDFSMTSGLFLHRESSNDKTGQLVFLQRPFPSSSFEADVGGNMSPNIPIGVCIEFNTQNRSILEHKMPHQCSVDMSLLARQFETELSQGD